MSVKPIYIPPDSARSRVGGPTSARGPASARSVSGHQAAVAAAGLKQWFALRQTSSGDCTEEASLTKALFSEIYQRTFEDAEALAALPACPEIGWLVECHCRAPMAPGWRKSKVAAGDVPLYASEETGEVVEAPPSFRYYVRLAELVVRARLDKATASQSLAMAHDLVKELKGTVAVLGARWSGPHVEPASGEEYWHNASTGESTWDNPIAWVTFICNVAEALLRSEAFPQTPAAAAKPAAQASSSPAVGAAVPLDEKAKAVPGTIAGPSAPPKHLEEAGDAWGALDALVELGDHQSKQPSAASAQWADMEQWIASQAKPKAQPQPQPQPQAQPPQPPHLQLKLQLPPQPQQQAASSIAGPSTSSTAASPPAAPSPPSSLPALPGAAKALPAKLPGVPAAKSAPAPAPAPPKPVAAPAPPVAKDAVAAPAPPVAKDAASAAAPVPAPSAGVNEELAQLARTLADLSPSEGAVAAPEDSAKALELLEAIERIPASFDDLRETKLGLITKPYKDSQDRQLRAAATRLRKAWKDMLAPKQK